MATRLAWRHRPPVVRNHPLSGQTLGGVFCGGWWYAKRRVFPNHTSCAQEACLLKSSVVGTSFKIGLTSPRGSESHGMRVWSLQIRGQSLA